MENSTPNKGLPVKIARLAGSPVSFCSFRFAVRISAYAIAPQFRQETALSLFVSALQAVLEILGSLQSRVFPALRQTFHPWRIRTFRLFPRRQRKFPAPLDSSPSGSLCLRLLYSYRLCNNMNFSRNGYKKFGQKLPSLRKEVGDRISLAFVLAADNAVGEAASLFHCRTVKMRRKNRSWLGGAPRCNLAHGPGSTGGVPAGRLL